VIERSKIHPEYFCEHKDMSALPELDACSFSPCVDCGWSIRTGQIGRIEYHLDAGEAINSLEEVGLLGFR
jgi:hypothetical protein